MDSINNIISSLTPDDINALKSAAESLFGSSRSDNEKISDVLSRAFGSNNGNDTNTEKVSQNNPNFQNQQSTQGAPKNHTSFKGAEDFKSIPDIGSVFDTAMLGKLSKIMSGLNSDGGIRCRLIEALKPNLSSERQKKADEAVQMLKLIELLPLFEGLMDKK